MNESEIQHELDKIARMSHREMASLWRYAPLGHPYFNKQLPFFAVFKKRFDKFGGMTTKISKEIG